MIDEFKGNYRFLSNFAPVEVEYNGIKFPSTEHAYVAAKTKDVEVQRKIAQLETSGEAKRFGRAMQIRDDFEENKVEIMRNLLEQKFKNEYYKRLLRETEGQTLVEGNNWHDNFWGTCFCDRCGNKGLNHLGKLLMEIRDK